MLVAYPPHPIVPDVAHVRRDAHVVVPGTVHRLHDHQDVHAAHAQDIQRAGEVGILAVGLVEALVELGLVDMVLGPVVVVDAQLVVGAGCRTIEVGLFHECVPVGLSGGSPGHADGALAGRTRYDLRELGAQPHGLGLVQLQVVDGVEGAVLVGRRQEARVHA